MLVKNVEKDQFFRVLDLYGFVARDYRVCCKTVKLGPTSQLIDQHFPEGCVSFIGQRRYESHRRSASRRIWNNPWVRKQIGASPIHNWTAMMIWLYIFQENASYNPLYEKGFERIGCMFCPASSMNELAIIADLCPSEWKRWQNNAERVAKKYGMSKKWLNHGFWRWKNPPPKIRELAQKLEIDLLSSDPNQAKEQLSVIIEPSDYLEKGLISGRFSKPIDLIRAAAFLPALGDMVLDLNRNLIEVSIPKKDEQVKVLLSESGHFTFSSPVTKKIMNKFTRTVFRGVLCTACGTCQSLCENNAITMDTNQARITENQCIQCEECLRGKCPSLYMS